MSNFKPEFKLQVCLAVAAQRITIQSDTEELWRVSFVLTDGTELYVKAFDDHDRLWLSDKAFLVVPTGELEGLVNDAMSEISFQDGDFDLLVIRQYPFGPAEEVHTWSLIKVDDNYEFQYPRTKEVLHEA